MPSLKATALVTFASGKKGFVTETFQTLSMGLDDIEKMVILTTVERIDFYGIAISGYKSHYPVKAHLEKMSEWLKAHTNADWVITFDLTFNN